MNTLIKVSLFIALAFIAGLGCKGDSASEAQFSLKAQSELDAYKQKVLSFENTTIGISNLYSAAVGKGNTTDSSNPLATQITGLYKDIEAAGLTLEQKLPALQQTLDQYRAGAVSFSKLESVYKDHTAAINEAIAKYEAAGKVFESLNAGGLVPNDGGK